MTGKQQAFGRNTGMRSLGSGTREVGSTFGTARHIASTRKLPGQDRLVFDSEAERLISQLLDFAPDVERVTPQGVTVDLHARQLLWTREERKTALARHAGEPGHHIYTGDFLVERSGAKPLVLEVKLDTYTGDDDYEQMLQVARTVLAELGYDFRKLVVPASRTHLLWSNVALLHSALTRADLWPSEEKIDQVISACAAGATTADACLDAAGLHVNYLPLLLLRGVLATDVLAMRFQASTPVEPAHGDLGHLLLLERTLS